MLYHDSTDTSRETNDGEAPERKRKPPNLKKIKKLLCQLALRAYKQLVDPASHSVFAEVTPKIPKLAPLSPLAHKIVSTNKA